VIEFKTFNNNSGFLYKIEQLKHKNNEDLTIHYKDLQITLSDGNSKNIDGVELYEELILRNIIYDTNTALQIFIINEKNNRFISKYLYHINNYLTIP
jgi:hypothetical protein